MWFIFIVVFNYLLPAIAAKSYRAKFIYFLNSIFIAWIFTGSAQSLIKSGYLENNASVPFIDAFIIPAVSILSILYFITGIVKIVSRRQDYINMFKNKHKFSYVFADFFKEFNSEEKTAIAMSFPGILIIASIVIKNLNFLFSLWTQ